jgi:RNA polymerase sigma factor (sigma-70 family)
LKENTGHTDAKNMQSLLDGLKGGESWAYRALEQKFRADLEFFVNRLIRNDKDAGIIVVENLGKMVQLKDNFQSIADLKSFLYVSCRNSAYDYLRYIKSQRKKEMLVEDVGSHTDLAEQDMEALAEVEAIRTELFRAMYEQIKLLVPAQRSVMTMVLKGKKTAEIADSLGLTEPFVRQLKSRAIKKIRKNIYQFPPELLYSFLLLLYR